MNTLKPKSSFTIIYHNYEDRSIRFETTAEIADRIKDTFGASIFLNIKLDNAFSRYTLFYSANYDSDEVRNTLLEFAPPEAALPEISPTEILAVMFDVLSDYTRQSEDWPGISSMHPYYFRYHDDGFLVQLSIHFDDNKLDQHTDFIASAAAILSERLNDPRVRLMIKRDANKDGWGRILLQAKSEPRNG